MNKLSTKVSTEKGKIADDTLLGTVNCKLKILNAVFKEENGVLWAELRNMLDELEKLSKINDSRCKNYMHKHYKIFCFYKYCPDCGNKL